MSQRQFIRALDADIHMALYESGLADMAEYYPPAAAPGTAPTPCGVFVDRDVVIYGEFNQVAGKRTQISVLRADLTPLRNGVLVIDSERYRLVDIVSEDDGITVWVGIEEAAP